jgi:hypothetical protein
MMRARSRRNEALSSFLACTGLLLLVLPSALELTAQEREGFRLTGTVVSEEGTSPLEGARVAFLSEDSVRRVTTADTAGRFNVQIPRPGRYVIEVELMGYADWESPPMDLGEPQDLTLLVPLAPVELEGVVVEGLSVCRAPAVDLRAGTELLREVRPILEEIERNSSLERYRYAIELSRPTKRWDRGTWRWVGSDTVRFLTDAVIVIEPPDVLVREGYAVAVDDSTNLYRAPGPATLSSAEFQATHCIRRVQGDTKGRVGLAFEPKDAGKRVEVEGTLWMATREGGFIPRRLDFAFVNVEPHLEERQVPWLEAYFLERSGPGRRMKVAPVDSGGEEYGGSLLFREVERDLLLITEWQVDQLSLAYEALFIGARSLELTPRVRALPTSARVLALVPREG